MMEAFIFDIDGTLADTVPLNIETFQYVFETLANKSLTYSEVKDLFGPNEQGLIQKVMGDQWQEGFALFSEEYKKRHQKYSLPYPGIREILHDLQNRRIRLAVVSGKGKEIALFTLEYLELKSFFDQVEGGEFEGNVKVAKIKKVLKEWNLDPSVVGYVGDAVSDMEDARACGLTAFGVGWNPDSDVLIKESMKDRLLSTPQELIGI
jgi:pyrophosphatase PpaX